MEYAARVILLYGLIFMLVYYGVILYGKLKLKSDLINNLIGGFLMSGILFVIIFIVRNADIMKLPEGRSLIISYTTYFIGPLSGLITVICATSFDALLQQRHVVVILLSQLLNVVLFYAAKLILAHLRREAKFYEIFVFAIIANTLVNLATYVLVKDKSVYQVPLPQVCMVILVNAFMFCALITILNREKEREDIIKNLGTYSEELVQQNNKIETLYQEVTSNQTILKNNFDELKRYEERIEYLAFHENQTGFLNNEKLLERLRDYKTKMSELYGAMLIIGINNVDKLEKTLGIVLLDTLHYLVGIEIIAVFDDVSTGQIFSIGKGKYAILLHDESKKDEVASLYYQLQKRFIESFIINTIELKVSIAAGGIELKEEVPDPEVWLEQCEFALYHAAASTSLDTKIIWFGQELMEIHARELRIEKDLYKALEKNDLYLVYQAQYNNDCKLIGAEALLRWNHKELGEISPVIFIPIAERNGLVDNIGKLVIQKVCGFINQNKEILSSNHINIPISINASFLELINPYFTQRFLQVLRKHDISSKFIRVEVTESEVSLHYDELLANLHQLSEAGIGVELDDFGTGYSSLNHLGSMPVHTIKIDKVFVDKIISDNKIGELVEMIIDFAHRFRMRVVAEGVETKEQFQWLKDKKCDVYQGYYFAKPMPEEQFILQVQENK